MTSLLRHPVAIGKLTGILVGLIAFFAAPNVLPEAGWRLPWGLLFWYITFGAVVGAFGSSPQYPELPVRLPWWVRAAGIGAWLNFVLTFFAWDRMKAVLAAAVGGGSPWWFVLWGAVLGLLIGFLATRFGGASGSAAARG